MHWRRKWQPLQCSCLENPRDGGAWWAAAYGVAQSRTRLKRLSTQLQAAARELVAPSLALPHIILTQVPFKEPTACHAVQLRHSC